MERAAGSGTPRWPGVALLGLAVAAAFAPVLRNGWVLLDDTQYVTRNPYVAGGLTLRGLLWSLHAPHGGNWHPLTSLSHMLDAQLFGLEPAARTMVSAGMVRLSPSLLVTTRPSGVISPSLTRRMLPRAKSA